MKKIEGYRYEDNELAIILLGMKNIVEGMVKKDLIKELDNIISNAKSIKTLLEDMHVNPKTMKNDTWRMKMLRTKLNELNAECASYTHLFEFGTTSLEEVLLSEPNELLPSCVFAVTTWRDYLPDIYNKLLDKPCEEWTKEDEETFKRIEDCLKTHTDFFKSTDPEVVKMRDVYYFKLEHFRQKNTV